MSILETGDPRGGKLPGLEPGLPPVVQSSELGWRAAQPIQSRQGLDRSDQFERMATAAGTETDHRNIIVLIVVDQGKTNVVLGQKTVKDRSGVHSEVSEGVGAAGNRVLKAEGCL